ncbi:MAG: penicillin-binding protein 2 [Gammaproteobacteria bacterium]|nr:penicillin-binding protein 2 [Gammaproteobacteria bacterium]
MARINGLALKDHIRESLIFNRRLLTAIIVTVLLLLVLLARLVYLQIIHQEHYSTLSEENRVNILPIPPSRGLIYDRNGIVLAQNLPSFSLRLVPEHIPDLQQTLTELRSLIAISDEDIERFHKYRKRKRRFEGIPLRFRLDDEEVARISVNQYRLPGVEIHAELTRHYPLGKLASHAVGYVGRINERELGKLDASNYAATSYIGKVGVERAYEELLHGQVGYQQVESNAQGRILHVLKRTLPTPGKNLFLNLDVQLQRVAEDAMGENSGALVALDPRNGAVLALVSTPTYDPNLFVNGLDRKTFKELRDSPDRPLFNRALRGQYPPGSTIKPFLGLAGLELDEIRQADSLNCPGWYMQPGDPRRYRDWKKHGHAKTDLTKAIVESCDVYFYDLSLALGIDRMHEYLSTFGLGQRTGIDVRGELGGILPSREWKLRTYRTVWYPGETLIAGIGQGFMLTTPLQLANITATLSMYGRRTQPSMISAIQDPADKEHQQISPKPLEPVPVAQLNHWESIVNAMQLVVNSPHGTAHRISYRLPYSIAGKTGTAQVFGIKEDEEYKEEEVSKKLRDHALFIGFAPVEDPQIAVAIIVENGGHGGSAAAPVVRKVMDQYLVKSSTQ